MKVFARILAAFFFVAGLAACTTPSTPAPTQLPVEATASAAISGTPVEVEGGRYFNLTPAELAAWLRQKNFFFVNTHTPYEGQLEGTDAFLPFDQTPQLLSQYPPDKDAPIVLYCKTGGMSVIAAEQLVKAGYTHVFNLEGGMDAWEKTGQLIVHK